MKLLEWAGVTAIGFGVAFFLVGIVGLVRFPDALTRLHTVGKADNLGLGLVTLGLLLHAQTASHVMKIIATWLFVMAAGATTSHLVAQLAVEDREAAEKTP